jgi:formylglycine-generating enzyme required for sulfatase activity
MAHAATRLLAIMRAIFLTFAILSLALAVPAQAQNMLPVGSFQIDETEVTIGQFRAFAKATGTKTKAEREGGGQVYELGWTKKAGWTWERPFGKPASDDEPAVHVTYDEAQAFCRWAGKRLPSDAEWMMAAYTETRKNPPASFETGKTYPYPTGATPQGANCLGDCGQAPALDHRDILSRGIGHAKVATTKRGVNGLFDMGANVWEWVDSGAGREKLTRGGSWWYGAAQMHRDHVQAKPADTAVVYIGFRCAK